MTESLLSHRLTFNVVEIDYSLNMQAQLSSEANLKNICVPPYSTLFYRYELVGQKITIF